MPYKIMPQCSGDETICEDVCSYNCVTTVEATQANGGNSFHIDAQFCVDCGACAIACPEKAIVYAGAYTRYGSQRPEALHPRIPMMGSIGGWDGREESPVPALRNYTPSKAPQLPEGSLILNGKVESWSLMMAAASN